MTTARDLLIVTLDVPSSRPVERGDLSLALAGAELLDLIAAEGVTLEDDRIVPGLQPATGDRLLDEAGAALSRQAPYESVEDWLWRRGSGLATAYADDLDASGRAAGSRRRRPGRRSERGTADDRGTTEESTVRRQAADRWAAREPVLVGLAGALGIPEGAAEAAPEDLSDDAVVTVLAAVNGALTELEAVRQRRRIEDAAFDNVWRAF
ncbi:GPP34 family phosphoprotein [Streptomyces sp. NPDC001843]|uniref:GPP34 family phosphoprotein n=1 Tax=Streptomyces sp. NPDC001843 TaxID=3364617 RepID=UPI0036B0E199